jgi:hypothetical protein
MRIALAGLRRQMNINDDRRRRARLVRLTLSGHAIGPVHGNTVPIG